MRVERNITAADIHRDRLISGVRSAFRAIQPPPSRETVAEVLARHRADSQPVGDGGRTWIVAGTQLPVQEIAAEVAPDEATLTDTLPEDKPRRFQRAQRAGRTATEAMMREPAA